MKKHILCLCMVFTAIIAYSQSTWTYNFSDTAYNSSLIYTDSILDPQQLWSIHLDTLTGQRWLAFEADSSMHKDSIKASCILKVGYNSYLTFAKFTLDHSYYFSNGKNAGYVEDSYVNINKWKKVTIARSFPLLSDIWTSGKPNSDSEFKSSDSLTSTFTFQCYRFKTDGFTLVHIKFTAYDYDTTPHHSFWKIFSYKTTEGQACAGDGIEELSEMHSLQIAPNPTTGKFSITQQDGFVLSHSASLSVVDISGREVAQQADFSASSEIDISKLDAGIYSVIVHDGEQNNSWRTRIVKE